jgi:hypothetical protein
VDGEREVVGDTINGVHFSLRLPIFSDYLTLFHEKMTLLFRETPVLVFNWQELALILPGIVRLLH